MMKIEKKKKKMMMMQRVIQLDAADQGDDRGHAHTRQRIAGGRV